MKKSALYLKFHPGFGLIVLVALAFLGIDAARAQQALERHMPPAKDVSPTKLFITPQDFGNASSKPLGVKLSGIHLIGEDQEVSARPAKGITGTSQSPNAAAINSALSPFIGKPLSLQLARDVQTEISKVYRNEGLPFVSVTLPPQEVTSGILQVRVFEFRVGKVSITGVAPSESEHIRKGLRVTHGGHIDARALDEDLTWINRSPYRRAEGVFRPAEQVGLSDLGVTITRSKPWQVYGGRTNTGADATGRDRYYVGVNALLAPLNEAWLSYQLTGGAVLWQHPDRILPKTGYFPDYVSHAGRLVMPTFARQEIEIAPAFVASRQNTNASTAFENSTFELPVIYRSAISNILPDHYWGDIYGGIEVKTLHRTTFFNNVQVASGNANLLQFVIGWSNNFKDSLGNTSVDLRIKANPGGLISGNDSSTWSTFTNGRVTDMSYAYGAIDITRVTKLPARFAWVSEVSGIWSNKPLPDTERFSLGGLSAARGYNYDDVSVDVGLVWRNELRFPTFSPMQKFIGKPDRLSPFVFADLGFGKDQSSQARSALAGIGTGFDYSMSNNFTGSLVAGWALRSAGNTSKGDWSIKATITGKL